MPPKKQRFNAKARQSVAGGSSHKKGKSKKPKLEHDGEEVEGCGPKVMTTAIADTNAEIITEEQRRAQKMMQELIAQQQNSSTKAISSKKRKRFEAYVAKQLKKEDRVKLLASLAETSAQVNDRSKLISTSTLGTGKGLTNEERLDKLKRKRDGLKAKKRRAVAFDIEEGDEDADLDARQEESQSDSDSEDDSQNLSVPSTSKAATQRAVEAGPVGEVNEDEERRARIEAATRMFEGSSAGANGSASTPKGTGVAVGSALALGPDGKPLMPVTMRKRKKKEKQQRSTARSRLTKASGTSWGRTAADGDSDDSNESDDEEFDSSASSEDSSSEDEAEPKGADTTAPSAKGKAPAKAKAVRFAENDDDHGMSAEDDPPKAESDHAESDEEVEEEQDRVLFEAMKLRGLDPASLGFGAADADSGTSEDSTEEDQAEHQDGGSAGESTEEELEEETDAAILAELKRRGLNPKDFGFPEDDEEDEEEASHEEGDADSPPWEGFNDDEVMEDAESQEEEKGEDEDEDDQETSESDDDSESDSEDEADLREHKSRRNGVEKTARSAGFKDWAQGALGLEGSGNGNQDGSASADPADGYELQPVAGIKVRVADMGPNDGVARGPLGQDEPGAEQMSEFASKHYAELKGLKDTPKFLRNVAVERSQELQEARLQLPVVAEEEHIVKTILENPITVICGETGSGKTTQVPQFLYERGFGSKGGQNPGMIGITQPRRVAALSMAKRVASELSLPPSKVSHQIRYDVTTSSSTAVKFMTDGVLLRELATDFLLSKYSAIMIDEAHERSVNTDILIGLLTRIVRLREKKWLSSKPGENPPLRLIIMSATLRVSDFTDNLALFPPPTAKPPVIEIGARQHPVTIHFSRRTAHDYLAETVSKVSKIHARLPPGGILVFLTGQQEITTVCKRLEQRYGRQAIARRHASSSKAEERPEQESETAEESLTPENADREAEEMDLGVDDDQDLAADVEDGEAIANDDEDALDTDDEEAPRHDEEMPDHLKDDSDTPMHILPLYSLLSSERQMRVFQDPPEGTRLVVVATNVAETSLTIPNIRYVVDCGRAKERSYDAATGIQSFNVSWISKASASQRAGRAGRTGPGHCYRLYSSAVYEDHFDQFSMPEILRTPIDGLILQMKAMNIIHVTSFPFPTCPERDALIRAERTLIHLNALEKAETAGQDGRKSQAARVTDLGRAMSQFPLSPRFAKLLVQGQQHSCLPFVIALVAAFSVGDPFLREESLLDDHEEEAQSDSSISQKVKEERAARRKEYFAAMNRFNALGGGVSDAFRLLTAIGAYAHEKGSSAFCDANFLRQKAMEEIHKLRAQLSNLVAATVPPGQRSKILDPILQPPSEVQFKVLRQLVTAAFVDQVAIRADLVDTVMPDGRPMRSFSKMKSSRNVPYLAMGVKGEYAYIHPASILFHGAPPEWVVFMEVHRSRSKAVTVKTAGGEEETVLQAGKPMLKGLTKINPAWLSTLGRSLCTFDKPADSNTADLTTLARAAAAQKENGKANQLEREILLTPRYAAGADSGAGAGLGWELPPVKAKQHLVNGKWVVQQ